MRSVVDRYHYISHLEIVTLGDLERVIGKHEKIDLVAVAENLDTWKYEWGQSR